MFDVTRKVTYTNLVAWYTELRRFCPHIPCICIANKIDVDYAVTSKAFAFPKKEGLPFFFVSAADGTNVVAIFKEAIRLAWANKTRGEKDFAQEVLDLIDDVRRARGRERRAARARAPHPPARRAPANSPPAPAPAPPRAEGARRLWPRALRRRAFVARVAARRRAAAVIVCVAILIFSPYSSDGRVQAGERRERAAGARGDDSVGYERDARGAERVCRDVERGERRAGRARERGHGGGGFLAQAAAG